MLKLIKNKSNIMLIIIGLIIFISIVFALYNRFGLNGKNRTNNSNIKQDSYKKVPIKGYSGKLKYNFQDKARITLPNEMFLSQIVFLNTFNKTKNYASSLDIKGQPRVVIDSTRGKVLIFSDDNAALIAYSDDGSIVYSKHNTLDEKVKSKLKELELINIARQFLVDNFQLNKNFIGSSKITYFQDELAQNRVSINLYPKDLDHTLITQNPNKGIVNVLIKLDGTILGADINIISDLSLSKKVNTLSYEEVLQKINKATVVLVGYGFLSSVDFPPDYLENATVVSITPSYLLDSKNKRSLTPIYVIKGTVIVKESGKVEDFTAYLNAAI